MRVMVAVIAVLALAGCQALWTRSIDDLRSDDYAYKKMYAQIDFDAAVKNYDDNLFKCNGKRMLFVNREKNLARAHYSLSGWAGDAAMAFIEISRAGEREILIESYAFVGTGFDGRPFVDGTISAISGPIACPR